MPVTIGGGLTFCGRELKPEELDVIRDRKSTRLNSSHRCISYAVFSLNKSTQPARGQRLLILCFDLGIPEAFGKLALQNTAVVQNPPQLAFFNDTAATEIYPLSLHDALPI